jgi:hypothetical protein
MPKNTGKGGKNRKRGKNENEKAKRDIILKVPGEAYAAVIGPLGQYQMALRLEDMTTVKGIVRGALARRSGSSPATSSACNCARATRTAPSTSSASTPPRRRASWCR